MRILIVDDESDMRESLRMLLEVHGDLEVVTASSAFEAQDMLVAMQDSLGPPPIDLILTDVTMPDRSGIELCQHVKSSNLLQHIPVLVLTGRSSETILQKAFDAGAHDFLPKGIGPVELLARLRSAMNLKRELDQRMAREQELLCVTRRLERANDKLRRLSMLDELTGVPNRRYFNLMLTREWGRASREDLPLALVILDVDWFKSYNDRYGHPAGDACLIQIATALASLIRRPGDLAARYGGEEFVILLANTTSDGAAIVAETVRAGVAGLNLEHLGSSFGQVTISSGAASMIPGRDFTSAMLLQAADEALYRAKAGGRNRIEKYQRQLDLCALTWNRDQEPPSRIAKRVCDPQEPVPLGPTSEAPAPAVRGNTNS